MKRHVAIVAFAAAALAAGPSLSETAPGDVVFGELGEVEESLTGTPGNPDEGRRIMAVNALGNCVACHPVAPMEDVPFHGNIGPELEGAGERWTEAQLRGIVIDAKHTFPETFMPGMYKVGPFVRVGVAFTGKAPEQPSDIQPILSAQQVEDVVAYLVTLK